MTSDLSEPADELIEPMDEFFVARLDFYDEHMLTEVEGLPETYAEFARHFPPGMQSLLDLGCGTGLELEPIFARFPDLQVTGIDLSQAMLNKLREKFPDKPIELICASYLDYDFGLERYDAATSFESLHHLDHALKLTLYQAIFRSIKPGGSYLEADYMVDTQAEEDHWFAENRRLRAEQGIRMDELYHYDTPLTISNQKQLLEQAGFYPVDEVWRVGATSILVARKPYKPTTDTACK